MLAQVAKTASPQVADHVAYVRHLARIWGNLARFGMRTGPYKSLKTFLKYPWLENVARLNRLYARYLWGRSGNYLQANGVLLETLAAGTIQALNGVMNHADELVMHEDLVPPEILFAMDLKTWCLEFFGFMLPMLDENAEADYLDLCENEGIPSDICSLPKAMMGMALAGHLPRPRAIVSSNSPCDGGMSSYALIEKQLDVPVYRLDVPYHFDTDRAVNYFVGQLEELAGWLGRHTGKTMDWDALKRICEERNRMVEAELGLWDMLRARPTPLAGEPIYLSHLWCYTVEPGKPGSTELVRRLSALAADNLDKGIGAVPGERFRLLLWGPFPAFMCELFAWAERRYGVALVMDSLSFNRLPTIDTTSRESTLRGLAHTIMHGPMARHSRGPADNFFDDLFYATENFDIDMVWLGGHIGCKNSHALSGMLREKCREAGIPLLLLEFDLSDPRIVPREKIKKQIEHFMENVMKATPRPDPAEEPRPTRQSA